MGYALHYAWITEEQEVTVREELITEVRQPHLSYVSVKYSCKCDRHSDTSAGKEEYGVPVMAVGPTTL